MSREAMMDGSQDAAARAAVSEIRFFSRIMFEHAKFIRGGLDPTLRAGALRPKG